MTFPRPEMVASDAEAALRGFGVADRATAERVLELWPRRDQLSRAAYAQVLDQFPQLHPRWCDPQECSTTNPTGGQLHASAPVDAARGLVVQLTQYRNTPTIVEILYWYEWLDASQPEPDPSNPDIVLILTLDEAQTLASVLHSLHDRARAGGAR